MQIKNNIDPELNKLQNKIRVLSIKINKTQLNLRYWQKTIKYYLNIYIPEAY